MGFDLEMRLKNLMTSSNGSIMLILSSPSGAGKTTITKKIQQKYQNFKISVSHTTRKPRPNEIEGVDYFFVSYEEFKKKIFNLFISLITLLAKSPSIKTLSLTSAISKAGPIPLLFSKSLFSFV